MTERATFTPTAGDAANGGYTVLLAVDSFKGSASSRQVEELLEQGVRRVCPDASVVKYPIADGGEGTVEAVATARNGEIREATVSGPLGAPVTASYALFDGGRSAVLEMAQSSGITLIEQNGENALRACTEGVGQMLLAALEDGAERIIIGLGGSATSDGGAGMARALGARILDANGEEVPRGLEGLCEAASIDCSGLDPRLEDVEIVALTDVTNPLTGDDGAIRVYGRQKGIDVNRMAEYDGWMHDYARLVAEATGRDPEHVPGAGAAGGLGAALVSFCGAEIVSGIDAVLDIIGLDGVMGGVDLVITGEGRMDSQSANGKAPVGVARLAKRHGKPVAAVVGSRADDLGGVYDMGVDLVVPTVTGPATLDECIARVGVSVPIAGESVMRAFLLGRGATPAHAASRPHAAA